MPAAAALPWSSTTKYLPVSALLDSLGLVLATRPDGKPSCSPLLPHWKVVSGLQHAHARLFPPPLPVPQVEDGCRAALPWHSWGTGAAGQSPRGSWWLQGQSWECRSGCCRGGWGTWVGMCWDCHQGRAPAHHHRRGLKESPRGSRGRGSCLAPAVQLALPSAPPFPAWQIQETSSAEICFALSPARSFF